MRIVVTGSSGLLGSYLCPELRRHGHEVVEFDLSLGQDVRDTDLLLRTVEGADAVVHLASPSSSILFDAEPAGCWSDTLVPLSILLDRSAVPLVVPSSATVYGDAAQPGREHDWLPEVRSAYACAKRESERLAMSARLHGRDVSICRIFTGYGGREHHKVGYASQPFSALDAAMRHEPYEVFGDGEQSRDFVHADDVALAMRLMLESPSCPPLVNVGTGYSITVNEMLAEIRSVTGLELDAPRVSRPTSYVRDSRADLTLARSTLGFEARVSFAHGISEMMTSFAAQERR